MKFQVVTVTRQQGVGKASGKAYDFQNIGGLIQTGRGPQYVELMLEKDHPAVEIGKSYDIEMEFYPDREKKLAHRVAGLKPSLPFGEVRGPAAASK